VYSKEIIHAIGLNHTYEYCIVSRDFKMLEYSKSLWLYCDLKKKNENVLLFDIAPEFIGFETELESLFEGSLKHFSIPLVFKEPEYYVNIHVHASRSSTTLIVLFENITEITKAQQYASQVHNENLLLLQSIEEKNRQLKAFSEEMQGLVKEEVEKNIEKQHMLELQTRHAQMGEMISLITHQWKQPLSVIQTVGTMLKIKQAKGTLHSDILLEKIDDILKQAEYMDQTVNDFQTFFTPSKSRDFFDVRKTIESVLGLIHEDYALENIQISIKGDDAVIVKGYPNEYKQVILSIMQNAKEAFRGQKTPKKYIEITVEKEANKACVDTSLVCIKDNAGGIPKKMIDKIFTQYVSTKKEGSGLGLYIAKSVIEKNMQGALWVESIADNTIFFIRI